MSDPEIRDGTDAAVPDWYDRIDAQVGATFDEQGPSGDVGADLVRYLRLKLDQLDGHRPELVALLREAADPDSPVSPLRPSGTRTAGIMRFAGWVEGSGLASGEAAADLGRALWLVHLSVIAFWVHDRSDDRSATEQTLSKLPGLVELLPVASMMVPGFADGLKLLRLAEGESG